MKRLLMAACVALQLAGFSSLPGSGPGVVHGAYAAISAYRGTAPTLRVFATRGDMLEPQSVTSVFALDRSLYPTGAYVGGLVPTNRAADISVGPMHHSSFSMLGRHPDAGWFQGAVWQPTVEVTRPDGSHRRHTALLMTAYLVSEYDSPTEAHAAVRDLYIAGWSDPTATPRQKAIQLRTTGWHTLGDGTDGRIYAQTKDGYTIIVAAFSVGRYDVEDVTLVAPHTPRASYRTMRTWVLRQLKALDQLAHFSNHGENPRSLTAPGQVVISHWTNSSVAFGSGTSSSAAFVAGVMVLLRSQGADGHLGCDQPPVNPIRCRIGLLSSWREVASDSRQSWDQCTVC